MPAAALPATPQNIANIKRNFPMYANDLDEMIAEGAVSLIYEQKVVNNATFKNEN